MDKTIRIKVHDFNLSSLLYHPLCPLHRRKRTAVRSGWRYVTSRRCSSDATCDLAHRGCASSGARGSRDNAARRGEEEEEEKKKMTKKKKKTKSRGGGGSDGGGRSGGGGGGEGERSSSVKHATRTERTSRHSALRPRYTANMAAEGRIGGGQPRRQPMSS